MAPVTLLTKVSLTVKATLPAAVHLTAKMSLAVTAALLAGLAFLDSSIGRSAKNEA